MEVKVEVRRVEAAAHPHPHTHHPDGLEAGRRCGTDRGSTTQGNGTSTGKGVMLTRVPYTDESEAD